MPTGRTGGARRPRRPRAPRRGRGRHQLRREPQHQFHQRLLHRLPVLCLRAAPHRRRRVHALAGTDRGPGGRGMAGGATEICMQGGIHPDLPGTAYFDIAAEVKRRWPDMHVTRSPRWRSSTAPPGPGSACGTGWSGQGRPASTPPGHRRGDPRRRRPLDPDQGQAAGRGLDRDYHHRARARHPDQRHDDVRARGQPRALGRPPAGDPGIQERNRRLHRIRAAPFVHTSSPIYLAGLARPGPTRQENRAVHAVSRLMLHGASATSSAPGSSSAASSPGVLRGGANDLGGTLMEETISRMAGAETAPTRRSATSRR